MCGSRIWSRGPRNFYQDFADVAEQIWVSQVSHNWLGSRAHLKALEALAFLTFKYMHSPTFPSTLSSKLLNVHLCG